MAAKPGAVHRKAAAKINLYLHVTGKRADGYHLLDSLFVFMDRGDEVEVAPADGLSLELAGPYGPELGRTTDAEENLIMRAARLLQDKCDTVQGAHMRLVKNLPLAAGVGGGSADAAAVLRALSELWNLSLSPGELAGIGLQLGADVPACLVGSSVLVSGIGEQITPSPPLPDFHLVLVNPGVALSTPQVFAGINAGAYSGAQPLDQPVADVHGLVDALRERRNDLEAPAIKLVPEKIGRAHV